MSQQTSDDYFKSLLTDPSALLDTQHHDVPERHTYGGALIIPTSVKSIGPGITAAAVGSSPAPARADHVHAFQPAPGSMPRVQGDILYQAGPFAVGTTVSWTAPFKCNIIVVTVATCLVNAAGSQVGLVVYMDGTNMGFYADQFWNQANVHAMVGTTNARINVTPGAHTFSLNASAGSVLSDANDRSHHAITAIEVP